ncbi:MAG: hypothetical protein R8K47_02315 [Mariprofundaceae bacterium]
MTAGVLAAFGLAWLLAGWFASGRRPLRVLDEPNERSLHTRPVPRTGGVAIVLALAAAFAWVGWRQGLPFEARALLIAAGGIAVLSFADDLRPLPAALRLLAHLLAAGWLAAQGFVLFEGASGWLVSVLGIVWMLNLYNFMDGMDGFAGGMAVFGFGFLGLAGWLAGDAVFAGFCGIIAAAAAGFLVWNFPPARIFMGDAGSATLGLLAGGASIWGVRVGLFGWWLPLLVFSPFVVDATVTLLRRALRGEKVWLAHRSHYYQRLVLSGWSHRQAVLTEYALMLAAGATALMLPQQGAGLWLGLAVWAAVYALLARAVDRRWPA